MAHSEFLRRALKTCLLSRRIYLISAVKELKHLAQRFTKNTIRIRAEAAPSGSDSLHIDQSTGGQVLPRNTCWMLETSSLALRCAAFNKQQSC